MISCSYFLYLYGSLLTLIHYRTVKFSMFFNVSKLILNLKLIESSPQLNLVESYITTCSKDSHVSCHLYCKSGILVFKHYHNIFHSGIQISLSNILICYVCQLQTSFTPFSLVYFTVFNIFHQNHSSRNVRIMLGILTIIIHTHSRLDIQYN